MIRLISRMALSDNRGFPGRTIAVAVLLVAAAWLPALVGANAVLGVLVAIAAAFSATVGSVTLAERRAIVLEHNGARRSMHSRVAAATMVLPGLVAWVVASGLSLVVADGPTFLATVIITVVVPVLTAPFAVRMTLRSERAATGRPVPVSRWRRSAAVALLVLVGVLVPLLGFALIALRLTSGAWSTSRARRAIGAMLALAIVAASVVLVAMSRTWTDLALALTVVLPGLAVAVVVIGIQVVALIAGVSGRLGPWTRLALAPLTLRRRTLAPMIGLVALTMTLAVTQSVVGASFGEREANRQQSLPSRSVPAGNRPDEVIVPVPPVDPGALRSAAAEELTGTGASAVVIEQVGTGEPLLGNASEQYRKILGSGGAAPRWPADSSVWLAPAADPATPGSNVGNGSLWLGVVAPDDLALLGWRSAAKPLAAGMVVLSPGWKPDADGTVDVVTDGRIVSRSAVTMAGPIGGARLPGALVSADTAQGLSPLAITTTVVVVPTPGAAERPSTSELIEHGKAIRTAAFELPTVDPPGLSDAVRADLDTYAALASSPSATSLIQVGSDPVQVWRSGPLNDVAYFAGTAEQGRRQLLGLILLPVLVTLAAVFLALGATRRDDLILEVQGAPDHLRSVVAAVQAGVVTVAASLLAVMLGIGVPAAAFALYNRGATLPDIPLVVPGLVWFVLIVVPLGTVVLAAGLPLLRRRAGSGTSTLDRSPEFSW